MDPTSRHLRQQLGWIGQVVNGDLPRLEQPLSSGLLASDSGELLLGQA